ncbi:MAG: MOSC domain-containing protein YiiM [Granulosicoccus sp.]|jgi:MOSC domain-containing protein YiiM
MNVVSVNTGKKEVVEWRGQQVETGIFKYPVKGSIHLGNEDVVNDSVVDRKYHGGIDKAMYAYSHDHYPFWIDQYPDLEWNFGMFGENLTIEGMDESKMNIGSIYQVGLAKIQVCQPRQPCFKLGIRFKTQAVLKTFVNQPFCGVYFRVIEEGDVTVGDELKLVEEQDSLSVSDVYQLLYKQNQDSNEKTMKAMECVDLPKSCKASIWKTQTGTDL